MFGLEDGKKKGWQDFQYDLEQDIRDPEKKRSFIEEVRKRIQALKGALRDGEKDQVTFDKLGTVLYGYVALITVADRIEKEAKKKASN